ncbi:MAG TPA: hypothetical protein VGC54_13275 [Planctomycetota bacterium]
MGLVFALPFAWSLGVLGAGEDPNKGDRGGPVVVGGLPCMVEPALNDMFWAALGGPDVGSQSGWVHTAALIGPPDMAGVLLDAWGTPYGRVNARTGYRAFGLVHEGTMVLSRSAMKIGVAELWYWVPAEYFGGDLVVQSSMSTTTYPIISNAFPVPIRGIAQMPGLAVGNVTVLPNAQNEQLPPLRAKITASGTAVLFEKRP